MRRTEALQVARVAALSNLLDRWGIGGADPSGGGGVAGVSASGRSCAGATGMGKRASVAFSIAGSARRRASGFRPIAQKKWSGFVASATWASPVKHFREHLVAQFSQIAGYRCLSLMRALAVVKCQSALA